MDNKTEQNEAQYHLDRQTSKVLSLSSGNVGKYDSLTFYKKKQDLLGKAVKKFQHLPLSSELKKQTDIEKKQKDIVKGQNQRLNKVYGFNKRLVNKKT